MRYYVIQLPPTTKKNHSRILTNRRTGRPFVVPSSQYKDYETKALGQLGGQRQGEAISGPVNVRMTFYMPTRRRVDMVNLEQAALDILVLAGILEDDNAYIVAGMDGSRVKLDRSNPRTEIEITEVVE